MQNNEASLKKKYDKLYTQIIDDFAESATTYSVSTYAQGLKYFFSYLCDIKLPIKHLSRESIKDFISERYKSGNSIDTIEQYLERVHFLLANFSEVADQDCIDELFEPRFITNTLTQAKVEIIIRETGNYKKSKHEISLASDPEKLREIMKKLHPRS